MFIMVLKKNCYQTKKVTSNDLLDLRISSRGVYKFWEPFLPPPPFSNSFFPRSLRAKRGTCQKQRKFEASGGYREILSPWGKNMILSFAYFLCEPKTTFFLLCSYFLLSLFLSFPFFPSYPLKSSFPPRGGGADRKINTPVYLKPSWLTFQMKGNDTSSWFVHIKNQSEVIWPL